MKRKKLVTLIGGVCLILVLAALPFMAACPAPAEEEAPTQEVLKIGTVQNLGTPMGLEKARWLELLVKLTNEKGGWEIGNVTYTVELIMYDSGGDQAKAKEYLERLVLQDSVKFILDSPTGNPAVDTTVTEQYEVICLGLDTTGTSTDPAIQYYWTPNGMFFGRGLMYDMYSDLQEKGYSSYVSVKEDTEMGHIVDEWCGSAWLVAAPDVEPLETVFFSTDTADFAPVATKIMSLNPEVVDMNYVTTGRTEIPNALYDLGFRGIILPAWVDPIMFNAILTHCGPEFMEGWEFFLQDPRLYPNQPPEVKAYLDAYTEEYGEFQSGGCMWVAYWFVLEDAILNTQSTDVEDIKAYLDDQPHPVRHLTGYTQLFARPDANNLRTISGTPQDFVGTVHNGEIIPLVQVSVQDHYLATILCYGLVDVYKEYWEQYGYPTFPADQPAHIHFSDLGITGHD